MGVNFIKNIKCMVFEKIINLVSKKIMKYKTLTIYIANNENKF